MPVGTTQDLALQLTYPGTAALAVVRVQGPSAAGFVARHFDRQAQPCKCVYGRWRDEAGEMLDDVVVVEGRQWFDVNLHGGRRIVAKLLEQAAAAGFEVVTGDATIETAAEDEIAAALPRATTELGLRWLLGQPAAWGALEPPRFDVEALLADLTLRRLLNPATVAIIGAPNVGKSTLANALFGQERAIVADVPGTTRDWVGGLADLGGMPVVLVDTPGHRETLDPIEREAISLSEAPVAQADVVVEVIDAARAPLRSPAPRDDAAEGTVPHLYVANKCDLAPAPPGWLAISAKTGAGLPALIAAIHGALSVDVAGAHQQIRANLWNSAQEKLLREGGARAVAQLAHRLGNW